MAGQDPIDSIPPVGGSSSSTSGAYDPSTEAQNAYTAQELLEKANEAKHKPTSGSSEVENEWDFSKEQMHKLYENLCNACVNQCKEDQDKMKEALQELKESTSTS